MDNILLYKLIVIILLVTCIILLFVSCYNELFINQKSNESAKKILIVSEKNKLENNTNKNNTNKNNTNKNNTNKNNTNKNKSNKYDYIIRFNDNVRQNDNTNIWFIDIETIKDEEKLEYIKEILTNNFDNYSKIIIEQNEEYNKDDIINQFPRYKRMLKSFPNILDNYGVVFLPMEYNKYQTNEEKVRRYMLDAEPNCIIQII